MADHTVQTDQASIAVLPASVRHRAGRRDRGPAGGRRAGRFSARCVTGIAAAVIAIPWSPLHAQSGGHGGAGWDPPEWVGDAAFLGLNALSSGISAGTIQLLRGGSFTDGFTRGALGGTVHYAGLRLTAQRFDGAGLLGRQVAAAGTSIVGNAGRGAGLFDRLSLPVGPVWLDFDGGPWPSGARIDGIALGWILYAAVEPELRFDLGRSLSAGTPVFHTNGTVLSFGDGAAHAAGVTQAGVILLADVPPYGDAFLERSFAHERIHVLQQDFMGAAWTDPLARLALDRAGAPPIVGGVLRFNLSTELLRGLGRLIPEHEDRPWEIESIFFAR